MAIDGDIVGAAPFEHTIAAGRHVIAVEREKFARSAAEVDCLPSSGLDILLAMAPEQSTEAQGTP